MPSVTPNNVSFFKDLYKEFIIRVVRLDLEATASSGRSYKQHRHTSYCIKPEGLMTRYVDPLDKL